MVDVEKTKASGQGLQYFGIIIFFAIIFIGLISVTVAFGASPGQEGILTMIIFVIIAGSIGTPIMYVGERRIKESKRNQNLQSGLDIKDKQDNPEFTPNSRLTKTKNDDVDDLSLKFNKIFESTYRFERKYDKSKSRNEVFGHIEEQYKNRNYLVQLSKEDQLAFRKEGVEPLTSKSFFLMLSGTGTFSDLEHFVSVKTISNSIFFEYKFPGFYLSDSDKKSIEKQIDEIMKPFDLSEKGVNIETETISDDLTRVRISNDFDSKILHLLKMREIPWSLLGPFVYLINTMFGLVILLEFAISLSPTTVVGTIQFSNLVKVNNDVWIIQIYFVLSIILSCFIFRILTEKKIVSLLDNNDMQNSIKLPNQIEITQRKFGIKNILFVIFTSSLFLTPIFFTSSPSLLFFSFFLILTLLHFDLPKVSYSIITIKNHVLPNRSLFEHVGTIMAIFWFSIWYDSYITSLIIWNLDARNLIILVALSAIQISWSLVFVLPELGGWIRQFVARSLGRGNWDAKKHVVAVLSTLFYVTFGKLLLVPVINFQEGKNLAFSNEISNELVANIGDAVLILTLVTSLITMLLEYRKVLRLGVELFQIVVKSIKEFLQNKGEELIVYVIGTVFLLFRGVGIRVPTEMPSIFIIAIIFITAFAILVCIFCQSLLKQKQRLNV